MTEADLELLAMRIMACVVSHSANESKRDALRMLRKFRKDVALECWLECQTNEATKAAGDAIAKRFGLP